MSSVMSCVQQMNVLAVKQAILLVVQSTNWYACVPGRESR